ncbi:YidC/Oxa1 family membrane protein insertase [Chakrabartyella piscis]|uniref:YidC/Oxa1 family membrane protein insertase n=1 Tax=Chakrabartyella piscis TaxID=2918914 RepID=UPI002958949D|nr:YidC/Oxa1 family membrane protein insertase [Chakrabartyella piscis]
MFGIETVSVALSTLPSVRMPGNILGPISSVMGSFYNMLFEGVNNSLEVGVLGVAIILFTLIIKTILFPLTLKQQKSSMKMQMLQPEMEKIKNKYKGKTDKLSQQKQMVELQDFQKKNGVNMMGGCLPLLIQLPILYALFYIFQNAYVYVDAIGQNYTEIANLILQVPVDLRMEVFAPFAQEFVDKYESATIIKELGFDLSRTDDLVMLVNYIKLDEWATILPQLGDYATGFTPLLETKAAIETFLTIPLVSAPGLGFPGILIPIFAAGTTFLQSKLTMSMSSANQDPNNPAASMTKTMTYMMPLMMGFFTISMPAGLGLYWSMGNIIGVVQQVFLKKYYAKKLVGEVA